MKSKTFIAVLVLTTTQILAQQNVAVLPVAPESYAINTRVEATTSKPQAEAETTDAERVKSFSKSFSADVNDKITFNNQYGSIIIKTWDKKEVKVDIDVKAYSNSDSEAQKLIDAVSIDAAKTGDAILVKTNMGERNGRYGRGVKNGVTTWRREVKINYVVYMPAVNSLTVLQQYGNVEMGNFSGPTSLKVQYGNLTVGNLSHSNNYINVQYGKCDIQDLNTGVVKHSYNGPVTIGSAGTLELDAEYVDVNINNIRKSADIKVQYGKGLTIGTISGNLLLNAAYAKVNINTVKGNAVIKQAYGDLNIASAGKLGVSASYTNVVIGTLNGDGNIKLDYNRLRVNEITGACKNFNFDGDYAAVDLGFEERYNANFSVSTSYAGFKYGEHVAASLVSKNDNEKKYEGKIGNGGSANVSVKSEYGSITFK
ncbi:DUF4097 family beta strand repeat-containing protein [Pedobacter sandarakinus]|uniref:hypothetical protein n=1 Tax=Pedobacter sandarakinus TaxID=353156 RepID=UPI0022455A14|nr:hypothetical protein [Pedobacter sandarakinus]MCX2573863.1 hypothetical protein [Pedobacter sandarakinus]